MCGMLVKKTLIKYEIENVLDKLNSELRNIHCSSSRRRSSSEWW